MKVRCWAHIALGAALPWMDPASNIGLTILFCAYQYLQYLHRTTHKMKDDSYLDIKETAVVYAISATVIMIMKGVGYYE